MTKQQEENVRKELEKILSEIAHYLQLGKRTDTNEYRAMCRVKAALLRQLMTE